MPVTTILCPLPGTFYRRSAPGESAFKEVGDAVSVGETAGLVEIMKSFTAVSVEVAGRIVAFHVADEDAVMPDQPLFDIES